MKLSFKATVDKCAEIQITTLNTGERLIEVKYPESAHKSDKVTKDVTNNVSTPCKHGDEGYKSNGKKWAKHAHETIAANCETPSPALKKFVQKALFNKAVRYIPLELSFTTFAGLYALLQHFNPLTENYLRSTEGGTLYVHSDVIIGLVEHITTLWAASDYLACNLAITDKGAMLDNMKIEGRADMPSLQAYFSLLEININELIKHDLDPETFRFDKWVVLHTRGNIARVDNPLV